MLELFRRYRDPLIVLVLVVLPFVFYWSNSKETREHNPFDRVVVFVSAPIQWVVVGVLDGISGVWHRYIGLVDVQADNDSLRAENSELKSQLAAREEAWLENDRLRLLLGVRDRASDFAMLTARVIAVQPSPIFRSLRVNRGQRDGVTPGAAVINHDGVVGRVIAVTDAWADVMLLVDANNSTDVLVQRTRSRARVRGTGADEHLGLEVEFLARTADVRPGDVLITSGTGATFPKGLTVGTIMEVERGAFGLYQHADVEPSVDFTKLEEVIIIPIGFPRERSLEEVEQAPEPMGPMLEPPAAPLVEGPLP